MEKVTFQCIIAKNIKLYSNDHLAVKQRGGKMPLIELINNRQLVVLLTWLEARERHIRKYIDLYLDKGFDVLQVSTNMWNLMWPTHGCQVSASCVLEFLYEHEGFQTIFAHGLSCGTYVWSEVLVKAALNMDKYKSTLDRVKGQVYDSPPGLPPNYQKAFAVAIFPKNYLLSLLFEYVLSFQLFVFYNIVTKHLIKGFDTAFNPPVKIPSLMFISKDDFYSPFSENMKRFECWQKSGLKAYLKCWEHSSHVAHYLHHREEYLERLNSILDFNGLNNLLGVE